LRSEEVSNAARPAAFGDAAVRLPTMVHQLVHLLGHCQLADYGYAHGNIALRDLLEAAALTQWGNENVDWHAVYARFAEAGHRRPLLTFLWSLNDGAGCPAPVPDRVDLLTALQRRRMALQARSTTFAYVSSGAGWWLSEFKNQIAERDAGQPRVLKNLKRLAFERGAIRSMARAFLDRRRCLVHVLPHLSWLGGL
jgi:hypothetical protein